MAEGYQARANGGEQGTGSVRQLSWSETYRRRKPTPKPIVDSEDQLIDLVLNFDGMVSGLITPQIAEWALKLNTGNRPIIHGQVERYVREIESGSWMNNGQPIIMAMEGVMNDGQHRLLAVVQTGRSIVADMRFGIPREAFSVTDTGNKRTAGQVAAMAGFTQANTAAAIAKALLHHRNGSMGTFTHGVENHAVLELLQGVPAIAEIATLITNLKTPLLRRSWFGGALAIIEDAKHTMANVTAFAHEVDEGQGAVNAPARQLKDRLVRDSQMRGRTPAIMRVVLAVKSYNLWFRGQTLTKLQVVQTDMSSKGFPQVVPPTVRKGRP